MDLKSYIRDIPDFPKKGIIYKDITTLLKTKKHFRRQSIFSTKGIKNNVKSSWYRSKGFYIWCSFSL